MMYKVPDSTVDRCKIIYGLFSIVVFTTYNFDLRIFEPRSPKSMDIQLIIERKIAVFSGLDYEPTRQLVALLRFLGKMIH